jgi:hypothetical protein
MCSSGSDPIGVSDVPGSDPIARRGQHDLGLVGET